MKWHLSFFFQPSPIHWPHGYWENGVIHYQSWQRLIPSWAVIGTFPILRSYCKLRIKICLGTNAAPPQLSLIHVYKHKVILSFAKSSLVPSKSFLILQTQNHCRCTQEWNNFLCRSCRKGAGEMPVKERKITSRTRKGRGCVHKTLNFLRFQLESNKTDLWILMRYSLEIVQMCCRQKDQPRTTGSNTECNPLPLGKAMICLVPQQCSSLSSNHWTTREFWDKPTYLGWMKTLIAREKLNPF